MATEKTKLLTADDLLELYSRGVKGELIRGVFCETVSAGIEHGEIASNFIIGIGAFVKNERLGRVFGSDSGVRLESNPDTVREPDVGYISFERLTSETRITGYLEAPPELVVEVASPSDTPAAVQEKAAMWLSFGVMIVWVAHPDDRTVDVYRSEEPVVRLTEDDVLDGDPVLPGFTLPVREVFP